MTWLTSTLACCVVVASAVARAAPPAAVPPPSLPLLDVAKADLAQAQERYRETSDYDAVLAIVERVLALLDAHRDEWQSQPRARIYEARAVLLSAFAHERLRHVPEAIAAYHRYLEDFADTAHENRGEALASLASLERLGFLALQLEPAAAAHAGVARVQIDGAIARADERGRYILDEGRHRVVITAAGFAANDLWVVVEAAKQRDVRVVLVPEGMRWQETAGWIAAGVATAALTAGIVCWVVASDKRGQIRDATGADGRVPEAVLTQRAAQGLLDDAHALDAWGAGTSVMAGVAAGAAAVFFLLPTESPVHGAVVPLVGGGYVALETQF